ncbi:ExeM/NucH family extracellular endonuclease [Microbacterium sp. BK668]|uniref:ExeM/NucH family extracellular endonuclease n=1 Tax=Microbacterium sp. BK668 TaxID=2512118 RepID=UPI0010F07A14|nr:ExeM/NucH family extracellular endonuclease [Microbacterium sp. BK668]TDN91100.1 hypothetical protein EV279_0598 [Microbacterium sp. BK668]
MHRSVRPLTYLVAGALAFGALAAAPPAAAIIGTDLMLSEVIEGSSNNKAVEIYNPTAFPVALGNYDLVQYTNGSTAPTTLATLSGTLASGGVFVVAHASANDAIKAQADVLYGSGMFNGNDAIALRKSGVAIDVFGQIGFDPGSFWGTGNDITQDRTLRREADRCGGDPIGEDAFDPTVGWDTFPRDTVDDLGVHTSLCEVNPEPDPDPDPEPEPDPVADCAATTVAIGSVQGAGASTPVPNTVVRVEGVVVGDFQTGGFDGYYVQDAGDGNAATSDGIFVYQRDDDDTPGNGDGILDVSVGDVVHVVGTVSEAFGMTQITPFDAAVCATGAALPAAAPLSLPATTAQREALEGMYVTLPQSLAILEYFNFAQFGTIAVGLDRQYQPTATFEPGSVEALALRDANIAERITIDDGRSVSNPDPAIHPDGGVFTLDHSFRGGDLVTDATGVLDYRFSTYGIQPTQGADFESVNPRPEVPEVGGDLKVSSFNVLNYFVDLDPSPGDDSNPERGANTAEELARQQAKIVAALADIDADVFGLIEIQNNGDKTPSAVATLTAALNAAVGSDAYDYIRTGKLGTDVITTAFLYKKATVEPLGDPVALTGAEDPRWLDTRNRPALTQTFRATAGGEPVTVSVNHLKSKGSSCASDGDPDLGDGQGNCNKVRTAAAQALAEWLAKNPTKQGTGDRSLIIGDLNSYDKEDPIDALKAAGYTDLIQKFQGEDAYSYLFDGQLGYLDHALASAGLVADITGAAPWNINSDEPGIIDYDMTYKAPAQDALYAPDPYRSSDHDPVLVGIDLDTTPPGLTLTPSAGRIMPPDNKERVVTIDVVAEDESDVSVALVSAEASGSKKAHITRIDDTTFRVVAANKAVYTFTYRATDAAGNTTTESVKVVVGPVTD